MFSSRLLALTTSALLLGAPMARAAVFQGYNPTSALLFPRNSQAKSLFVLLHGSGQYAIEPKIKRKANGTVTKFSGFNAMLPSQAGTAAAFPTVGQGTIKPVGNGRVVKIIVNGIKVQLRIVQNPSGTAAHVFLTKRGSKAASTVATADTSNFFWNSTYTQLGQVRGNFQSFGNYTPVYNLPTPLPFSGTPQASSTSYVDLPADVLTALSDVGRLGTKAVVIATLAAAREIDAGTVAVLNPNNQTFLDSIRQLCSIGTGVSTDLALEDPLNFTDPLVSTKSEEVAWLGTSLQSVVDAVLSDASINPSVIQTALGIVAQIPVKPLTSELRLVVAYTWGTDQQDLDTGTEFLGNTVGFAYADTAPYMFWTGDDVNGGGAEIVQVDLNGAVQAGAAGSSFSVNCYAGWYQPAGGFGPATLNMGLLNTTTGQLFGAISRTINPGTQAGQATTFVGSTLFNYDPATNLISYDFQ